MIKIHRIKCGNGNCYVLEENGNAVLVDTGSIEHQKKIEEKIRSFPIKLLLLTHAHFDHCQNAAYFSKLFQAPIAMNPKDVDLIQNQMKEELFAKTILGKVVLKASLASFKKVEMDFKPSVFLEDGDTLEKYGISANIIALPGHTKGSIGIDCKDAGVLVGDALYLVLRQFHLTNTLWVVILYPALNVYNLVLMRNFFEGIPASLYEAATLDGSTPMQTFIRIVLPMSKPALASIGLMYAVSYWNDYTHYKLYINNSDLYNFQMRLRGMIMGSDLPTTAGNVTENTVKNAAIIIVIIPFMILYPFLQKYFVQGVNIGAVKE